MVPSQRARPSPTQIAMDNPFEADTELQPQTQAPPSSGTKGCLIGCLVALGIFVAACICMGVAAYTFVSRTIATYTSDTPMEIQTVEYNEEDMAALQARVDAFREALDNGETPKEDLILTAADINALIAQNEDLRGRVYVNIENDQVEGDVSIPLDKIPMCKGRYLNGSARFGVSLEDGVLIVTAEEVEVNGNPVPEQIMSEMRKENLAKDVYKNPKNAKFLRNFEEIRVDDDKLILRFRRDESSDETSAVTPEDLGVEPVTEETVQ